MSKIIWKDIDSSTIKGLLICELPPITKPKMRVQETTIDGVDGSIIEELGYETYDKSIRIGLTRDFDIDEVIKYFTGEGNIVFSNEPNKYYKAKIIEQIDYTRLLRFREAEVKFRVQPFKYEYQEEEQSAKTGIIEGAEIKVSDAKLTQLIVDGRSTQDGTPTPDAPVEIESVGYNNLLDLENIETNWATMNDNLLKMLNSLDVGTYTITLNFIVNSITKVSTNNMFGFIFIHNTNNLNCRQTFNNNLKVGEMYTITSQIVITPEIKGQFREAYLYGAGNDEVGPTATSKTYHCQLTKGAEQHSYIPYGKSEIEVETVGKNMLQNDLTPQTKNGITVTINEDKSITFNGTSSAYTEFILSDNLDITLKKGIKYILSTHKDGTISGGNSYLNINSSDKTELYVYNNNSDVNSMIPSGDIKIIKSNIIFGAGCVLTNFTIYPMLEKNQNMTEYQPYQKNTSVMLLNAPLRSLPNGVKDKAYIKNNKLYVGRYIGSVILNGSENWKLSGTLTETIRFGIPTSYFPNSLGQSYTKHTISNYFEFLVNYNSDTSHYYIGGVNAESFFFMPKTLVSTMDELKTWLSTNNVQIDYELATPVTEEYGDVTILELVDGENNISNSENAIMAVDYVDNKLIINNLGNYTSKPIFEIEGAGTIRFILNDNSVFTYNFDADGRVVIDSEKEDAYLGSVLKNRNMNGEFPKLEIGENKITWDGLIKNISVSKKSRWL